MLPQPRAPADELRELREANAMLSRFASQAAHDIQEPLRLLAGYLDLLVAHQEGRMELDAPQITRDARDTAVRMQQLVAGLLEFSRATRGTDAPARPVPLGGALDDALDNLRLRIAETGAQVTHDALPTVRGDRTQLARLFQNLVENSLKYVGEKPPAVHVASRAEPGEWVVTVDDNGAGWPREGRERLFQPFMRLHRDGTPGAGLGLATVRAIVERMRGSVRAADAPDGGARVEIRFPRDPP